MFSMETVPGAQKFGTAVLEHIATNVKPQSIIMLSANVPIVFAMFKFLFWKQVSIHLSGRF